MARVVDFFKKVTGNVTDEARAEFLWSYVNACLQSAAAFAGRAAVCTDRAEALHAMSESRAWLDRAASVMETGQMPSGVERPAIEIEERPLPLRDLSADRKRSDAT